MPASELVHEKLGARALRLDDTRQEQRRQLEQKAKPRHCKNKQQLRLSRSQAKRLGLFDVASEFKELQQAGLSLEEFASLHALWQQYALSVCGLEKTCGVIGADSADKQPYASSSPVGKSSKKNSTKGGKRRRSPSAGDAATPSTARAPYALQNAFARCGAAAQMDLHGAWVSVHRSTAPSCCGIAGLILQDTEQVPYDFSLDSVPLAASCEATEVSSFVHKSVCGGMCF